MQICIAHCTCDAFLHKIKALLLSALAFLKTIKFRKKDNRGKIMEEATKINILISL